MAQRYSANPLGDEPEDDFTFSDATLLTLLGVATLAVTVVLLLGSICAEHRIVAALSVL